MRILFICDEYPPGNTGGIGTTVQNLGRELVKQGHDVFVVGLYAYRFKGLDYFEDRGVKVWRLRYSLNLPFSTNSKVFRVLERMPKFFQRHLNGQSAYNRFQQFIDAFIQEHQISVIELADYNSFAMYIGFPVEWPRYKVPMVVKIHGSYTYFANEMQETADAFYRRNDEHLFQRADAISAVSAYAANASKSLFGIKRPIEILYNGLVVPELPAIKQREPLKVIFTGTLVRKKGVYALMQAWNLVHKQIPKAELYVYGKGKTVYLENELDSGSRSSVNFMGHVSKETLVEALVNSSLAVFPSYSETFGMGVVEAMAYGCPVIYTKRSCGPEIVKDGVEGLLVDPDNVKELAEAICYLLNNAEIRDSLAKGAYLKAKHDYSIEQSSRLNVAFYTKVIESFRHNAETK
jgi:glycosyltransferase involved in cell wall biosynthesis